MGFCIDEMLGKGSCIGKMLGNRIKVGLFCSCFSNYFCFVLLGSFFIVVSHWVLLVLFRFVLFYFVLDCDGCLCFGVCGV